MPTYEQTDETVNTVQLCAYRLRSMELIMDTGGSKFPPPPSTTVNHNNNNHHHHHHHHHNNHYNNNIKHNTNNHNHQYTNGHPPPMAIHQHHNNHNHSHHHHPSSPPPLPATAQQQQQPKQQMAVEVHQASLAYGRRGKSSKPVLNSISLNVPEAAIYGLLGPSGCGKTTLLRCIVGRIRPQQGYVRVFGYQPNEPGSHIPGPSVGYMPQEVAVYDEFSIEEMLFYFGRLFKLSHQFLNERILFLISFLDLPAKDRLVKHMSGGQKRRVSLAAALVHSPPLLILDEPTVGVDPLLRQSIWNHLVTLTRKERITVIVTTHYIEEARQANVVGLMRQGRLLAEDSPDRLMAEHQLDTLEDVFLKLCMSDLSFRAAALANHTVMPKNEDGLILSPAAIAVGDQKPPTPPPQPPAQSEEDNDNDDEQQQQQRTEPPTMITMNHNSLNNNNDHDHHNNDGGNNDDDDDDVVGEAEAEEDEDEDEEEANNNKIATKGDLRNIFKLASVFSSSYYRNKDSSYDLAPTPPVHSTMMMMNSTTNLVRSDDDDDAKNGGLVSNNKLMNGGHAVNGHVNHAYTPSSSSSSTVSAYSSSSIRSRRKYKYDCGLTSWREYWFTTCIVAWKNFTRLRRNIPLLLFQFLLPAIQVILFCLCIGGEPVDINVAVVNEEQPPYLSKLFLSKVDPRSVRQNNFTSLDDAIAAVKRGDMWGVLHIPPTFSINLQRRVIMGEDVDNETIEASTIRIYPDLTNQQISFSMEKTFREAFQAFAKETLNLLGQNPALAETPIALGFPVYGDPAKQGYLEYMAPGVVVSISYIMATGLTSLAFIIERRDGLFERSLVAGVDTMQILFSHALVQISVMNIQIMLVLIFTFLVFDIPSRGPFVLVIMLLLAQGATGMAFGLVVSALCKQENTAVMMILGSFYPNLILSGIIWPLEAMPHWIQVFSYILPQTIPTESLRHILSRGWSIQDKGVWLGFAVTGSWFVIYILIAAVTFKIKK